MLMCRTTLGFRVLSQKNVDHSPLDHGRPTCGLAVFIARPPPTFVNYASYKNYTLIQAVLYTTYSCFSTCGPRTNPQKNCVALCRKMFWAGIAQSVWRLATGWVVRGSNPGRGQVFRTRPDRRWSSPILTCSGYWVFPGGKAAGAWR